jgi:uncharacterized protein YerC
MLIDKSNSTELGEAINTMFRWYEEAQICYAFLEDVPSMYATASLPERIYPWKWYLRGSR